MSADNYIAVAKVDALPFVRGMERAGLSMAYVTFRMWANARRWQA